MPEGGDKIVGNMLSAWALKKDMYFISNGLLVAVWA